jgi:hypothetical protein
MLSTKKAMTYGVENPSPGLVQAQKCGRVKHDISIPTLPPRAKIRISTLCLPADYYFNKLALKI